MAQDEGCFVDEEMEPDPRLNQITNAIIGAAIEVHRTLGPGHLESAYENAMAVRSDWRRRSRRKDVKLIDETFPNVFAYAGAVGMSFDQARQKLNSTHRVALAHGQVKGGRPRTASSSKDYFEVAGEIPVIRLMARTLIRNTIATLETS